MEERSSVEEKKPSEYAENPLTDVLRYGARTTVLTMVFQLVRYAEKTWRGLLGYRLAEIIAGVEFVDGEMDTRKAGWSRHTRW